MSDRKIKVVISGIFYPLAMLSYFVKEFQRRENVELFTVGPYTGNWIPWNGGMRLPDKYVYTPDIPLPPNNMYPSYSIVKPHLPWKPDLWIQIDAGSHFIEKPEAMMVIHIQTDPHVLKESYKLARRYSDISFCMQKVYMEDGEQYLPYAYDENLFYPMPEIEKVYDACLIGLHYANRDSLVEGLRAEGLNVYYSIGEVYDEYRLKYNQSRVALNWSSLLDLNARVFEACGMRIPLVSNTVPDMPNFFIDGEHYLGFRDVKEGVRNVKTLLANPEFGDILSGNAERKVRAGHRWKHRIDQILEACKLL